MKSDEGIFKMLSKSSIIRNQYENVTSPPLEKNLKAIIRWPFFYEKICLKDIVESHLKTQVLRKNQN